MSFSRTQPTDPRRSSWICAAAAMAVQAVAVLVMVGWLIASAVSGSSSQTGRAVTEAITIAVFGAGAVALSVALWRERSVARTPTLVWDGFVVFCGGFIARSGAPVLGGVAVIVGLAAFVLTLRVPALRDEPDDSSPVL